MTISASPGSRANEGPAGPLGAFAQALSRVRRFMSTRHRLQGARLLRITLGFNTLLMYALHFQQRAFIWGDHGALPHDVNAIFLQMRNSYSLYGLSTSERAHDAIFIAGMCVSALFVVGVAPRVMSVLFFVFTFSLYARNEIILDGGDNLLIIIAFLLMFLDTSGRQKELAKGSGWDSYIALMHNLAVIAVIVQVCILYFTSAWAKMMGHKWQDGTAVYYILRTSEFNLSPLAHVITQNAIVVALLTLGTIVLQIGFPFVIWHRVLKYPWIAGAFTFHIAIAYFMGLIWFSFTMLSVELILISDGVYQRGHSLFAHLMESTTTTMRAALFRRKAMGPIES